MLTKRFEDFIFTYLDADADSEEIGPRLREDPPPWYAEWLRADFEQAVLGDALTPELLQRLTGRAVPDAEAAVAWLRELWAEWFPGESYPESAD